MKGSEKGYTHKLAEALNGLRKGNELCDIVIRMGGRAFRAHKAVLAASSSYFRAMFTSGFRESTQEEITIDGKPEIFDVMLDYAYTGVLKITGKIAYDVLEMACYMQFTDASQSFADCIKGNA